MSFKTISAILRGAWLINRSYVNSHLPLIHGIITGKVSGAEMFTGNAEFEQPFAYANGVKTPAYRNVWDDSLNTVISVFNEDLFADNSAFIIPTIGPILKYNGSCGESGMVMRQSWASDFKNSKKLTGLISYIDSPGGQADGTPQYADFIKGIDKPKYALVDGGAYSAGAWIASAHDAIYAISDFSGFGSIGAYTTIVDYSGYFKKMGLKVTDVYPDESSQKNEDWRKAMSGDFSMIKAEVADLARYFIAQFAENRSGKIKKDTWTKGATFNAQDAISIGLIDGIETFEAVAGKMGIATNALPKRTISIPSSTTPSNSPSVNNMKFTNIAALAGIENPTEDQINLANADLTAAGITRITLVRDSFISQAASVTTANATLTTELATANAAITSGKAELATANTNLATANGKITELEAKVEAFGKNPGANHKNAAGVDIDAENDKEDIESQLAKMPHNQAADKKFGW